jgi:FtsP/CotA-like multicopper oxidase with cupredoxin domain
MVDGVKEFHLVAEEIEHEFAPGCRAKCWGYNGTTPGPTIEAVEGDRVRIYVTNRLPEHTTMHWHGILLPSGMDGVGGLSQPHIQPGETYAYEFTLQAARHPHVPPARRRDGADGGGHDGHVHHPSAGGRARTIDRDYAILLHNWALHPGTYRPDPSVMQDFDLWTFNSKVFPAIDPLVARSGERVRIRIGNLSMWNHPIHMHGPVLGHRRRRRTLAARLVALGGHRDRRRRPDARPGVRRRAGRLGLPLPHVAPHDERHGPRDSEHAGRRSVGRRGEIRKTAAGLHGDGRAGMAEHQEHTDWATCAARRTPCR